MQSDTEVLDRAVSRSVRHLMPWLLLMYVFAYLDRTNIGFAKNALQAATGIDEYAYAWGAGILSIGYCLVEIPSNLAMRRFGARVWMARIMISWGLIAAAMMFVVGPRSLYALRFALGLAEGGFFPGVMYLITLWIPESRRASVNGLFYFGAPIAFVAGGPVSGLLLDADGFLGLHGWQLMFMVDGLLAAVIGVLVFFFLDDRPATAKWLPEDERAALSAACAAEEAGRISRGPRGVLSAIGKPYLWYFAAIYVLIQIAVNGVTYYLPSQIGALLGRQVGFAVGLVTAIPWACALVASFLIPRLADRIGQRRLVAASTMAACAIGAAISATAGPALGVIALCITVAGFIAVQPIFWTFPMSYLGGAAAAGGLAFINMSTFISGIAAPQIRVWGDVTFGAGHGLYVLACTTLLGSAMILALGLMRGLPAGPRAAETTP
jgi:MFS family permease